jgi:hypothetical protein
MKFTTPVLLKSTPLNAVVRADTTLVERPGIVECVGATEVCAEISVIRHIHHAASQVVENGEDVLLAETQAVARVIHGAGIFDGARETFEIRTVQRRGRSGGNYDSARAEQIAEWPVERAGERHVCAAGNRPAIEREVRKTLRRVEDHSRDDWPEHCRADRVGDGDRAAVEVHRATGQELADEIVRAAIEIDRARARDRRARERMIERAVEIQRRARRESLSWCCSCRRN